MPLAALLLLIPAQARAALDPDELKLVRYVLRTPTAQLAPETIPPFLELDPAELPKDLRGGWWAKKEELEALAKIAAGRKKAPLRRIGNDEEPLCEIEEANARKLGILGMAGFVPVEEHEVIKLLDKTSCTECELQTEFTLRIFEKKPAGKPKKKPGRLERIYRMHAKDPLMALVSAMRAGQEGSGTSFFGIGMYPKCR